MDSTNTLYMVMTYLSLFQVKHFIADFPLQTEYMLGKFKAGWDWVIPLSAHCLVHATITAMIIAFSGLYGLLYLAVVDFVIHFTMDRIKASPNMLGKYKPDEPAFWYALGIDQMVHHLTHYAIIYIIVTQYTGGNNV